MKYNPAAEAIAKQLFRLYEDYYQREVFNSEAGLELVLYAELLKIDSSLWTTDPEYANTIDQELTALNIELFGLAWLDHNFQLFEKGKQDQNEADFALCTEVAFARSYLEKTKRDDIWSAAGLYSRTILEAAIAESDSVDWSVPRDVPAYYERATRSSPPESITRRTVQAELKRYGELLRGRFGSLIKGEIDVEECALRLANRLASVQSWRDGIMIPQRLASSFALRIGYSPNTEALLLFQRLTVGLYSNASSYINAVGDYGSWELARKAALDLRQNVLEAGRKLLERQVRDDGQELL